MDKRFPIEDQIDMLASALRGRVVTSRDADYDVMRAVALSQFDRRPAAVIRVANAADVAAVINFARQTDLPLAVRSGGHSTIGASACEGGLVIDLRELNSIDIDADARTAWVGTGLTAGEVTRAVEQHGLIVGFGDSATVGVGGLTLGGGVGYLCRKHGLTIDSLLAVELVTANGDILVADADNHPDLFWALRGGGGNFGVATRLKYQLHPLPEFTGGPLILPATPEVLAGFTALAQAAPDELSSIAMVMPVPPIPFVPAEWHGKLAFIAMMAFAGPAADARKALAPFRALAIPIADGIHPGPYSDLYIMDPPPGMPAPAVTVRSRFVENFSVEDGRAMIAALEASTAPMKMGQIRVMGGAAARVPEEATAFAHRQSPIMIGLLSMYAPIPEEIAAQERWATESFARLQSSDAPAYVNFLAAEGQRGLAAAYPINTWARLRQIKKQYDPENLFRLNQNIPPAA